MRVSAGLCVAAMTLLGCHSAPTQPVPLAGPPTAIAGLAGEWDGSYESDDGARAGTIDFHLQAGRDTAFGDVIMIPRGWNNPVSPEERPGAQVRDVVPSRLLTIRFVRVREGAVSGELDRYRDPDCGCRLRTVFQGTLEGDQLKGRYFSYHEDGAPPTTGQWHAVRKPAAPK